jgi:hypothetical protein
MWNGGNHWSGWVAYLSFFRHVAGLGLDYSRWQHYETAAEFGPRFVHSRFTIVSELPEFILRDTRGLPHSEHGPYVRWRDGRELYYWHGTKVPREWITDRASIDPALALTWPNIEQRRALAEIVGWHRVLELLHARTIDADKDPQIGTLLEVDIPDAGAARFLRVQCSTGRTFVLSVPVEMATALQANAWTYQLDADQYTPEVRT